MTGFLLTLIAVILSGIGARDQIAIAQLSARQGARPALLIAAIAISFASAALAAWLAVAIAPMLSAKARMIMAAMALAMAGAESLILAPGKKPAQPTESLGAASIVLLAHQITDAARFLIFAISVTTAAPISAGIGGAVAGAAVLGAGWHAPEIFTDPRLRMVRRIIGGALLLIGAIIGFKAFRG